MCVTNHLISSIVIFLIVVKGHLLRFGYQLYTLLLWFLAIDPNHSILLLLTEKINLFVNFITAFSLMIKYALSN